MKARLINCALPSRDMNASVQFYEALLGEQLARAMSTFESYYAWASSGVKLTVNTPDWEGQAPLLTFAVDDIDEALSELSGKGAKLVVDKFRLEIPKAAHATYAARFEEVGLGIAREVTDALGTMAIVADPAGVLIGIMQLEEYASAFFEEGRVTRYSQFLHTSELNFARRVLADVQGRREEK